VIVDPTSKRSRVCLEQVLRTVATADSNGTLGEYSNGDVGDY
jgi:hypothetical protein